MQFGKEIINIMSSENILSQFWDLASNQEETRLKAALQLLSLLREAQNKFEESQAIQGKENGDRDANDKKEEDIPYCEELNYCVKRLVKGLASSRKRARHGFATVLTEILSEFRCLTPEIVLGLIAKHLAIIGSAKAAEQRGLYLGQTFALIVIVRSQIKKDKISLSNSEWLSSVMAKIQELGKKKSYLRELCAKAIVDILAVVSTDVFTKIVYPSVMEVLESGWEQATPEKILIVLVLQRIWGNHINEKMVKRKWGCSFIADKKNYSQLAVVLQASLSSHPRLHCVWDEIFKTLFNNPASDFQLFWNTVVERGFFESSHDRKYVGFQLVKKIIPQISANQVSVVFGDNMMKVFLNSLSSDETYLYKAARELASSLPELVNQNKDNEVPFEILKHFLRGKGNFHFDKWTKTKIVENLRGTLKETGLQKFLTWLMETFDRGYIDSSEPESGSAAKIAELTRIAVLNQLFCLIKRRTALPEDDWVEQVLFFFLERAYFKVDPKVPFSSSVRQTSQQRFFGALKAVSFSQKNMHVKLYNVVQHAKELLADEKNKVASDKWTDEAASTFKKVIKLVGKIQKKREREQICEEDEVFEMLFCHMALQLFVEPEEAADILKELETCYKKQKKREEEDNSEEPQWVEVLTEVLLSLLTRPSSLFRHLVDHSFAILTPHLTFAALNLCIESVAPKENDPLEVVDESEDEEEEEDGDDEEMEDDGNVEEKETSKRTLESGGHENKNGEELNSSEDEENEVVDDDVAFRSEVKAALGPAVMDTDKEDSSSEDDLDDEAMMQFDVALATVFRSRFLAKQKGKNKIEGSTKIILQFKLRVLDLIEIFIKKQASSPFVLELIDPLLGLAWSSLGLKEFRSLGERAEGLLKNNLCAYKELPPISSIDANDVHDKIDQLIEKSMSAPSTAVVTLITRACLYLVRVLRGSQTTQGSCFSSKKASQEQDKDNTKENLLDTQRFSAAYKKALQDFMEKRGTRLHPVFFTELIRRHPHLGWLLAEDLIKYLESAVNNFRKSQACQMLLQLVSQKTPENSKHIKEIAPSLQKTIISIMTKVSSSETEMKAKHVREVLKLAARFVNEANKTEELSAHLQTNELKEGLTLLQQSALTERVLGIKNIINTIFRSLSRDENGNEIKHKKSKKRKREVIEHATDGTECNGVDSSQVETNGVKKKKKKKEKNDN